MIDPLILSNDGPPLTFIHANGYPLLAYQDMLKPLVNKYQVSGYFLRPFWPGSDPGALRDWRDFAGDYLKFLEEFYFEDQDFPDQKRTGVIAVGHSVGAMTSLLAAIQHPELFQALVLIEPVLFPPWRGKLMQLITNFRSISQLHPLIRKTLQRKRSFPTQEIMFTNYRGKSIFERLSDHVLMNYVKGLSREIPDGSVELSYSPEWEARIYETSGIADRIVWRNIDKVTCPVLVIRGRDTDTLKEWVFEQMLKKLPAGVGANISDAGHLVPLEKPERTSELITEFLDPI